MQETLGLFAQCIAERFDVDTDTHVLSHALATVRSDSPWSEAVARVYTKLEVVFVITVLFAVTILEGYAIIAGMKDLAAQFVTHIGCEIGALCIPVIVIAGMIGETVLNVFVKPSPIAAPYAIVWVSDLSEYIWNRQRKGKRG